jgi:iron complex outermembrane recepter protein
MPRNSAYCLLGLLVLEAAQAEPALEEIVVTATRTPTELGNFAGSISRVDGDDIATIGATHHSELLNRVPGAHFQRNSGQESLSAIRSPVLTGAGSCGSFLFLEDSIPIRSVGFCNVNDLFEVNLGQAGSIEVQRGPASAVYGSSAIHGAVNVISADPGSLPRLQVGLDGGPNEFVRGSFAVADHAEHHAWSAVGNVEHDGGWRDDSTVNQQKLNLGYTQQFEQSTLVLRVAGTNLDQDTAGFIIGRNAYQNESIARSNANPEAYRNAHALRASAHWQKPSEDFVFDARGYARSSRMEFLQHFLIGQPKEENGQDSVGAIVNATQLFANGAKVLTGVDVEYADTTLLEVQSGPTIGIRPTGKHYDYDVGSFVAALYLHWEQPLAKELRLTVGARGEYVRYDYDNHILAGNTTDQGTLCGVVACLYARPADRVDTFTEVTPKLGLTWNWLPQHTLYATGVRGYRAPETTELYRLQRQQTVAPLDAEFINSVEVGGRGNLFYNVRYAVAVFDMRKRNVILRDSTGFNVGNGKTRHRGVEYDLSYSPFDALTLAVSGTWAKHTYEFSRAGDGGETIVAGNDIDTAPRHLLNGRIDWRILPTLTSAVEIQHVGHYFTDAANLHDYGGHTVGNVRLGWDISSRWQAVARVNNVADKDYADRADFAFGNDRYFPGQDRAAYFEVQYRLR